MTIQELYDWAQKKGMTDREIQIENLCEWGTRTNNVEPSVWFINDETRPSEHDYVLLTASREKR